MDGFVLPASRPNRRLRHVPQLVLVLMLALVGLAASGLRAAHAAAGSIPGPPHNAIVTRLANGNYRLDWINPSTQNDGVTPLDDFGGIKIYRNGFQLVAISRPASAAGQPDSYTDTSAPASVYWTLSAFDRELAHNESVQTGQIVPPAAHPVIQVTPGQLGFAVTVNQAGYGQPLTVQNTGTGNLDVTLSEGAAWLSLDRASGSIPGATAMIVTVSVDQAGLAEGIYSENIVITSNDAAHPSTTIPVTMTVGTAQLQVDTTPLSFSIQHNAPDVSQTRRITNAGQAPLHFSTVTTAPWLTVPPGSWTLYPQLFVDVQATASATALPVGSYDDSLVITSDDPARPRTVIPVHLVVTISQPDLHVAPTSLAFFALREEATTTEQTLSISNAGYEALHVTSMTSGSSWLDAATVSTVLPHGALYPASISALPAGLAVGSYADTIVISSDDPDSPLTRVPVSLTITTTPPAAAVSPTTKLLTAYSAGAPVTGSVLLSNNGNESLHFSVSSDQPWLTSSTAPGTVARYASQPIALAADAGSLAVGSYTGHLTITSDDPVHPTLAVSVQLTVLAPQHIALDPDSLVVGALPNGGASASINVINNGAAPLTYAATESSPWMSLTQASGTLAAGAHNFVNVNFNAAGLALGDYVSEIRIDSDDLVRPTVHLVVHFIVAAAAPSASPLAFNLTVPWRSGSQTQTLTVSNAGQSEFWYWIDGGNEWLQVNTPYQYPLYPGGSQEHTVKFNPYDMPPGSYSQPFTIYLANSEGVVPLTADLTVIPTPPDISVRPQSLNFVRTVGSLPQTLGLGVANLGYLSLDYQATEPAEWLSLSAGTGHAGPDGTGFVMLTANPTGLAPGSYTTQVTVASNDADSPSIQVPVTLVVRERPAEIAPQGPAIEEVAFQCASGDSTPRFVELKCAGTGDCMFRSTYGLRATDRNGVLLFDQTNLFPTRGNGQGWPAGSSWLIGSNALPSAAGITPDLILPLQLDALGGVLTLYDSAGGFTVLHQFPYGAWGGINAPAPGHSLRLQPNGHLLEASLPDPHNSAGNGSAGFQCPCPLNSVAAGSTRLDTTAPTLTLSGSGDGGGGSAGATYDLVAGYARVSGDHAYGVVAAADNFYVGGITAGAAVHFTARLQYGMTLDTGSGYVRTAGAGASLRRSGGVALTFDRSLFYLYPPSNISYGGYLALALDELALRPFRLEVRTEASGGSEGGSGACFIQLDFAGLPPGATITSCQGFSRAQPTPIALSLLEAVAEPGRVRLTWQAPAELRNATVYRRDASTDWTVLGLVRPDGRDRLTFIDERVTSGASYDYRLGIDGEMVGLVSVNVPATSADLALQLPGRLADTRALPLEFDLPVTAPTRVELFDIQGRRLAARDLDDGARGHHHLDWSPGTPLASGLYLVRLTQLSRSVVTRVTMVH